MKAMLLRSGDVLLETGEKITPDDSRHIEVASFLRQPVLKFADVWSEYIGPMGGHGWRNGSTGEIVYGAKPGANGIAKHPEPSTNGHAKPSTNGTANGQNAKPQSEADLHAAAMKAIQEPSFLAKLAKLPANIVNAAKNLVVGIYRRAEQKYGPRWAKIIVATAIVTLPTPVTLLSVAAMTGLAHVVTKLNSRPPALAKMAESVMTEQQVKAAAGQLLQQIGAALKTSIEHAEQPARYFDELYHGPKAPSPDWMPAGVGPHGGKMWRLKPSQGKTPDQHKPQASGHEPPSHEALEAFEHTGHEAHLAHEAQEVSEVFGTHFQGDIHQAIHNAHASAEGTELHELGDLDAFAIIARNNYGPVLRVAKQLVEKVPKGRAIGAAIASLHDGASKLAEKMTHSLVERYGHATAGAILGAGSLMASSLRHTVGLGGAGGTAIPGQHFIGAIPLIAMAETGKRLGVIGHQTKIEESLARAGSWLHAVREAIGKPMKRAAAAIGDAGLKAAYGAGQVVGGYQRLHKKIEGVVDDPIKHAEELTPEQIKAIAKRFMEEYLAEFNRMLADSPLVKGIPDEVEAETHVEAFDEFYHGPQSPGPNWVPAGVGPQGGKLWKHSPQSSKAPEAGDRPDKQQEPSQDDLKLNYDRWYKAHSTVSMDPRFGSPAKLVIALKHSLSQKISAQMAAMGVTEEDAKKANSFLFSDQGFEDEPMANVASGLLYTWANTSNDHNHISRALQRVAAELFATKDHFPLESPFKTNSEAECVEQTEKVLKYCKPMLTAFLKATYETTQAFLKEKGITHLAVYRGMATPFSSGFTRIDHLPTGTFKKADHEQMQLQPMSSFSSSFDTARTFAVGGQDATMIKTIVPANRIFSTCLSGVGCLDEKEIVVLGGVNDCMAATFARNDNGMPTISKTETDFNSLFAGNKT